MPHLDLSYEGRQQAERGQLDNGKLPHGGYRGCRKHPLMYMSFDKGKDFEDFVDQEVARVLEEEELSRYGFTPSWSLLLHKHPSYTDESVLMRHELLAANKFQQSSSYDLFDPVLSESNKFKRAVHYNGLQYYRPNRTHQYLTSTELRNFAQEDVNIKYGRPTRTTLLRARQRSNSAPQERREFLHHLEDIRHSVIINSNPPYLKLQDLREGESLHSYLTGARYNRSHCLDSKSVDHSGVYMPRLNPALGCFFSGPKGLWYMEKLRQDMNIAGSSDEQMPVPPPASPRLQEVKPQSAPIRDIRIPAIGGAHSPHREEHKSISKHDRVKTKVTHRDLDLNPTGKQLFINGIKLPSIVSPKKVTSNSHDLNQNLHESKSVKAGANNGDDTNKFAAAKDIEDTKIAVEMNEVLAPVLNGPTVSLVTEGTDVTSPLKEKTEGEGSTAPARHTDDVYQDGHREHDTSPTQEEVLVNEKLNEVDEASRCKENMADVEVSEDANKNVNVDDQTKDFPEEDVRFENLHATTNDDWTNGGVSSAREELESDIIGQLAGQEKSVGELDDNRNVDESKVADDRREAVGVSGDVTFFITEHDGEENVTKDDAGDEVEYDDGVEMKNNDDAEVEYDNGAELEFDEGVKMK